MPDSACHAVLSNAPLYAAHCGYRSPVHASIFPGCTALHQGHGFISILWAKPPPPPMFYRMHANCWNSVLVKLERGVEKPTVSGLHTHWNSARNHNTRNVHPQSVNFDLPDVRVFPILVTRKHHYLKHVCTKYVLPVCTHTHAWVTHAHVDDTNNVI